jgi:TRAP-type C4-dicarboxylate transport system permease small subunit
MADGGSERRRSLDELLRRTRQICRLASWLGGFLFLAVSFLITFEIVLRKFFNSSIGGADELTGYALAAAASWSFGFAVLDRAHIRVDTFYLLLPSWPRAFLDLLALAAMLLFFGLILYFGSVMFADTVRIGTRSRTGLYIPLVIPQSIWLLGLVLSVGVTSILIFRVVVALFDRDIRLVTRLAGSKSAEEELEEELTSLKAQHEREKQTDPAGTEVIRT